MGSAAPPPPPTDTFSLPGTRELAPPMGTFASMAAPGTGDVAPPPGGLWNSIMGSSAQAPPTGTFGSTAALQPSSGPLGSVQHFGSGATFGGQGGSAVASATRTAMGSLQMNGPQATWAQSQAGSFATDYGSKGGGMYTSVGMQQHLDRLPGGFGPPPTITISNGRQASAGSWCPCCNASGWS